MAVSRPVQVTRLDHSVAGSWSVSVHPPGQAARDVSFVRGAPTQIGAAGFADPFGPSSLDLTFPAITLFDAVGRGELAWLTREANVDLTWSERLPDGSRWAWEGFIRSMDWTSSGLQVSCVGALQQLDNYLAKPEYPAQPLPYEYAISRAFHGKPDLRVRGLRVEWPSWWRKTYTATRGAPHYMVPAGVRSGQPWTGLLTRQTGSWDQLLTGYVQTLLQAMYTERGRWTVDCDPGRVPVLRHRDIRLEPDASTVVVDLAAPGVVVQLSVDYSQSLNAVYGQGTSLSGVAYSGMQVSSSGLLTTYAPMAQLRQVEGPDSPWHDAHRMRKEVYLQMQQGLNPADAQLVAGSHLARFAEPGHTGSITLTSDPSVNGAAFPRALVRAGMTVQLKGAFGSPEGLLLHVTESSSDISSGTTTLTVDAKYRDALTVQEVRMRGRDALQISRALIGGTYAPAVPDQLYPWSYADGSGYIPSGKNLSAVRLFKGMPDDLPFPWTDWTRRRPPSKAAWKNCYIRIGPRSKKADGNWAVFPLTKNGKGIPVRMAQAGQVRLLQIAAYDKHGNVLKVPFHVSFYYHSGVNPSAMPTLSAADVKQLGKAGNPYGYASGQHYPFFPGAWEQYNPDGTKKSGASGENSTAVETAGLIRAYGTYYERAGYWPGSSGAAGAAATGLLVDESQWTFDTTNSDAQFDPASPTGNLHNPQAGHVYVMIYCDAQGAQEVYFTGRIWRVEPGTGTS